MRHTSGFDAIKPLSVAALIAVMLPLILLPLASIFIFGTSKGLASFWAALTAPEAIFALQLSLVTSFWATAFNVVFGLFAAYVLSKYNFWGRNALIVIISLPTAIPTAVAGFALLLLWGPYGTLGRFSNAGADYVHAACDYSGEYFRHRFRSRSALSNRFSTR
jgi:ABC-type sulfate transport system permease component